MAFQALLFVGISYFIIKVGAEKSWLALLKERLLVCRDDLWHKINTLGEARSKVHVCCLSDMQVDVGGGCNL